MRVYGRVTNPDGSKRWEVVQTAPSGDNSLVYVTALCQVLALNLGESPFYASAGIPAAQSVIQQVYPDYYVTLTQQSYAPFFASLLINRTDDSPPTYSVNVVTVQGVTINADVQIAI